jgi:hypothetical protein
VLFSELLDLVQLLDQVLVHIVQFLVGILVLKIGLHRAPKLLALILLVVHGDVLGQKDADQVSIVRLTVGVEYHGLHVPRQTLGLGRPFCCRHVLKLAHF